MSKVFFLFIFFSPFIQAQDEEFFRKMLGGDLLKTRVRNEKSDFVTEKFAYYYDLTGDGKKERIIPSKQDGSDVLIIKNSTGDILFKNRLQAYGVNSGIYKIKLTQIGPGVRALILYYDEGETKWLQRERTFRIYIVTFQKGRFAYEAFPGPHIAIQKEKMRNQYWERELRVETLDLNKDGFKEIIISYFSARYILKFENGQWTRH